MAQNQFTFTHELIKGKIAEIIFEQMINHTDGYTILEFGYEKVVRQLANEHPSEKASDTIEIVRRAPDFAVINDETHDINLIEVKYINDPKKSRVLAAAKDIKKSWKNSCLFIASPEGFFYGTVDEVIHHKGAIEPFHHKMISETTQKRYLGIMNGFITTK